MSFIGNLKKAFGVDGTEDVYRNEKKASETNQARSKADQNVDDAPEFQFNEQYAKEMQLAIFDSVVKIFNDSLPNFLKNSVDAKAQSQYIYDTLDKSLTDYITNIGIKLSHQYEHQWDKDRTHLQLEMDALKAQIKDIEESREDTKRQHLSAERQKRALADRVHDLETKVVTLEAEKEQYDLENKSLINKVKVMNVKENDIDEMHKEIQRLQSQLLAAHNGNNNASEEILAEIEKGKAAISEKEAEIETLKQTIKQLETKDSTVDETINDLNAKVTQTNNLLKEKEEELAKVNKQWQASQKALETAQSELKSVASVKTEMEKLESNKDKKDARIKNLQKENNQLQYVNNQLQQEIDSLKEKIAKQTSATTSANISPQEEKPIADDTMEEKLESKSNIKISAIDESIYDTDWLTPTPPEGTPTRPTPLTTEEDFGYQAPAQKPVQPDNESQMSLF